jgi:hypothetical protein
MPPPGFCRKATYGVRVNFYGSDGITMGKGLDAGSRFHKKNKDGLGQIQKLETAYMKRRWRRAPAGDFLIDSRSASLA